MNDGRRARVGAVHALMNSIGPTQAAFDVGWPAADVAHLLDGSLYLDRSRGTADETALAARIDSLLRYSASTGAEGILFTGSFFGEAVKRVRATIAVPVLTSFEGVIDRALDLDQPLHVVATAADSVTLLRAELERGGSDRSRSVSVSGQAVAGAMEALTSGDPDRHDQLVLDAVAAADPDRAWCSRSSRWRASSTGARPGGQRPSSARPAKAWRGCDSCSRRVVRYRSREPDRAASSRVGGGV